MAIQPVAIVTGGSRGIGRGICQELAIAGYAVVINYAGNLAAAIETQQQLPANCNSLLIQGDVGKSEDRQMLLEQTLAHFGRIDVLINNAGITSVGRKDILEATEASWDVVLNTNLKGPFFLSVLVANWMKEHVQQLQHPAIINVSSLSATVASVNRGDYCISKAGMSMMTHLFALRLAEYGIRVIEVRPGVIETDMTAIAKEKYLAKVTEGVFPIPRLGQPRDVGKVIAWIVGNETPYLTGEVFNVDGGFHLRKL